MSSFRAALRADPSHDEVLAVDGDIDLATAHRLLEAAIPHITPAEGRPFSLDLSGVTFLDSTGVGSLLEIRTVALSVDRATEIVAMAAPVARVLELAGLTDLFTPAGGSA